MGYSITEYKEKKIISMDFKIEIWLRHICREVTKISDVPLWLDKAQKYWVDHVENYVNGCIDPRLDDFLTNDGRRDCLIKICERIYKEIEGLGDYIPKEYLNNLCKYQKPFQIIEDNKTDIYLKYGKALIILLKGEQKNEIENA